MIVEFIGLMGAGKTTLHLRTLRRLAARGQPVWTPSVIGEACGAARPGRLMVRARAAWEARRLVGIAARHLAESGRPAADTVKGFRWFLTDLGNHWIARRRVPAGQLVLFDEGLLQRMFNVFVHGRGPVDLPGLRAYARALPLPDVLVYLAVDPHVAVARTEARTAMLSPRFRRMGTAERTRVFADASHALEVLVQELREIVPRRVHIVALETADLEEAERRLEARLVDLLQAARRSRPDVRRSHAA